HYRGEVVANYFENLLPENRAIRERLRDRFHATSVGAFDLLAQIGRDCVGAVQLLPPGTAPEGYDRIECEPLTTSQVTRLLPESYGAPLRRMTAQDDESFRFSIAGLQE